MFCDVKEQKARLLIQKSLNAALLRLIGDDLSDCPMGSKTRVADYVTAAQVHSERAFISLYIDCKAYKGVPTQT